MIVRLNESNKKNEFLRNQFSSQDEKVKTLEQESAETKARLKKLSCTKFIVDNKFASVSIPIKPKEEKVYIPPFKRSHKQKAYFDTLDKGKCFDIDVEVSKPMSKLIVREQHKFVFVPTCYHCGVIGHIRPNCSFLRQEPKFVTRKPSRNIGAPKFVHVCHFCDVYGHIRRSCHKLKFKHLVFQSRICDDISLAICPYKLFHILLKNLSLLACERNLQHFSLS